MSSLVAIFVGWAKGQVSVNQNVCQCCEEVLLPQHQGKSRCVRELAGRYLVFLIKRQRLAQEQPLSAQRRPGRNGQSQKLDTLCTCINKDKPSDRRSRTVLSMLL